jgi:hypothetical protein
MDDSCSTLCSVVPCEEPLKRRTGYVGCRDSVGVVELLGVGVVEL